MTGPDKGNAETGGQPDPWMVGRRRPPRGHLESLESMKAAFAAYAEGGTEEQLVALRDRACDLTKLLKTAGWPMESIIVEIRSATYHVQGHVGMRVRDAVASAVAEAIKCFYA